MSLLRFIWSQWLVVVLCLHGARVSLITERYKCIYISYISNRPLLCTLIPRYVWKLYNKTHTLHVFLSRHCTWLRKISILARLHGKQRRYFMQKFCRINEFMHTLVALANTLLNYFFEKPTPTKNICRTPHKNVVKK